MSRQKCLPRLVRLDVSDLALYERAAEPGEWAVSGAFAFLDADPATLHGKSARAFRGGFLGVKSFGWGSIAVVEPIDTAETARVVEALAQHFVAVWGAPSLAAAAVAAEQEVRAMQEVCADHPAGTLLAIERRFEEDGIVERVRAVARPPLDAPAPAWTVMATSEEADETDEADEIDLAALASDKR
jgi:Family of unknown function (DUF6505)